MTPFLSLVEELLALPQERQPHLEFIWTMRDPGLLQHFEARVTHFCELGANVSCHITSTGSDKSTDDSGSVSSDPDSGSLEPVSQFDCNESPMNLKVTKTRPNLATIFRRVADDYDTNHNRHYNAERNGCALLCCGPPGLVNGEMLLTWRCKTILQLTSSFASVSGATYGRNGLSGQSHADRFAHGGL